MWATYLEIIDNLRSEKDGTEKELFEQLTCQREMYETKSHEFETLRLKYEDQNKDLIQKIEKESAMISKIEDLNNKNKDLNSYINNLLTTKEGFDSIHNTVADLSLALISKNDKELTLKQRNMIKDLFSNSQIKAIDTLKQKCSTLEAENSKIYGIAKNQVDFNFRKLLKMTKHYAVGIKECVNMYKFIDSQSTIFINDSDQAYFEKHVSNILNNYESDVKHLLPQIDNFMNEVDDEMIDLQRRSDQFDVEKYDMMLDSNALIKSPEVAKSTSAKQDNFFDGKNFTLGGYNTVANDKQIEDNPFQNLSQLDFSLSSKEDNLHLLKSLELKDQRIAELETKLKDHGSGIKKKTKKKWTKSSKKVTKSQEMRENMINDTIQELEMMMNEKWDLQNYVIEQPQVKESVLDQCMNDTIKEADEQDEEETQFDKNGNILSYKSPNKEIEPGRISNETKQQRLDIEIIDEKKYATISEKDIVVSPREQILLDYNFSLESESVKFEGDLVNESIRFD